MLIQQLQIIPPPAMLHHRHIPALLESSRELRETAGESGSLGSPERDRRRETPPVRRRGEDEEERSHQLIFSASEFLEEAVLTTPPLPPPLVFTPQLQNQTMAKSTTAALSLPLPPPRRSKIRPAADHVGRIGFSHRTKVAAAVRCCCIEYGGLAEAMREAQPYFVAHWGSTFVVVLAAQIVDGPHLSFPPPTISSSRF